MVQSSSAFATAEGMSTPYDSTRPPLAECLAVEQLLRIRRDFASRHHPDRAPSQLKDSAAHAMALANALIDGARRGLAR
jgi:hypothetical protein